MLKPKNWPLQVLGPLLPVPYMCVCEFRTLLTRALVWTCCYPITITFHLDRGKPNVNIEDAKHILQSDKLLGDKIDEAVKEWDA